MKSFKDAILPILDQFKEQGRQVDFWWRDDDVVAPTAALERMLAIAKQNRTSLALAAIPELCQEELAAPIKAFSEAIIFQHGLRHENRAQENEKKCEFPDSLDQEALKEDLTKAKQRLNDIFGEQFKPIFVPPWNRISAKHLTILQNCGFKKVSTFGDAPDSFHFNTHLDIIDWKTTRSFIGWPEATHQLELLLKQRLDGNDEPIGILSHHLVHDKGCWDFLETALPILKQHSSCRWIERFNYSLTNNS